MLDLEALPQGGAEADGDADVVRRIVEVSRAERRLVADFWPIALRDRLPVIPVPVRSPDPDAHLDLQAILDRIENSANWEADDIAIYGHLALGYGRRLMAMRLQWTDWAVDQLEAQRKAGQ